MRRQLYIFFTAALLLTLIACNGKPSVESSTSTTIELPDTNQVDKQENEVTIADTSSSSTEKSASITSPTPQQELSNSEKSNTQPTLSQHLETILKTIRKLLKN